MRRLSRNLLTLNGLVGTQPEVKVALSGNEHKALFCEKSLILKLQVKDLLRMIIFTSVIQNLLETLMTEY